MLSGNSSFFWTSHTFTHQNLNNATSSDSTKQVRATRTRWCVCLGHIQKLSDTGGVVCVHGWDVGEASYTTHPARSMQLLACKCMCVWHVLC
jgi:hypothetical protein